MHAPRDEVLFVEPEGLAVNRRREFGARQRFFIILTDAELMPTPLPTVQVCPREQGLARLCPLGAIQDGNEETLEICGQRMTPALPVPYQEA